MSDLPKLNPIKVIKFSGDRKSATTAFGQTVYRKDKLWMGQEYGFVACPPTGNHFIFHDPDFDQKTGQWPGRPGKKDDEGNPTWIPKPKFRGRWSPMCTCGSPAAVYGANAYNKFSSPQVEGSATPGQMLMCISMVNYGVHMDSSHD